MNSLLWSVLFSITAYVVYKIWRKKNFFHEYGIPHPAEIPYLGYVGQFMMFGRHINYFNREIYNFNTEAKYIGYHMFAEKLINLRDLELVKSVFTKNFDHFADRRSVVDPENDPLVAKNLTFLNGDRWREIRHLMSPAFTSGKLRTMYKLMTECAKNFTEQFLRINESEDTVDMKDAFTRYTNDVIATCAFGVQVDSLKNPKNEFYVQGKKSTKLTLVKIVMVALIKRIPCLSRKLVVRLIPKESSDFFVDLIRTTVDFRDKNGIVRPDMLQLMMEAREDNKLDISDMAAQAFVFFLGGFESTASHMCMIAHELAVNPDKQVKLQAEIDGVMKDNHGKPTYEAVNDMPYMDAVFNETMRLHPLASISRICTKEFKLPPALPGSKPYTLKIGDEVYVSIAGINRDGNYYKNPDKFVSERFTSENKKTTASAFSNLGFGIGPRMCVGNRFAILETKVLLTHLLHKSSFEVCEKTCIPLEYDKGTFIPAPKGGTWLKISRRN